MNGAEVPDQHSECAVTGPIPVTAHSTGHRHQPAPGTRTPQQPPRTPETQRAAAQPAEPTECAHDHTEPLPRVASEPEFAASQGILPVPDEEPTGEPVVERILVTLATRGTRSRDNIARAGAHRYMPPPSGGLDKFDLGSVPASVTPPRTWRRAAWFAALSSGATVVAMLLVGATLVSRPADNARPLRSWPDSSNQTVELPINALHGNPSTDVDSNSTSTRTTTMPSTAESPTSTGRAPHAEQGPGSGAGRADLGTHPIAGPPAKPRITPASTSTAPVALWAPYESDVLAQRSQDYFNTVTEDPEAAHAMTTGQLAAEGPDGLAQRYADVAYFEVQHVYVDATDGYTVTTVKVTHLDGSADKQAHTLEFAPDNRIKSDTV